MFYSMTLDNVDKYCFGMNLADVSMRNNERKCEKVKNESDDRGMPVRYRND